METFYPGQLRYEEIVAPLRGWSNVDVYGFAFPLGVLPERTLVGFAEVLAVSQNVPERVGRREMAVQTRAWLDGDGPRYERIVLLNHGPHMLSWTDAVSGSISAPRVTVVPVHHRTGLGGTLVKRRIHSALT
jgi:hypothetical protein